MYILLPKWSSPVSFWNSPPLDRNPFVILVTEADILGERKNFRNRQLSDDNGVKRTLDFTGARNIR